MNLPKNIFSGNWKEGHVQGIAVDTVRGYVYYSFTTILLKTDMEGNAIATVENLIGHLGCIAFDSENNRVYGSLELKHDSIGAGIVARTGKALADEDAFYLVSFDVDKMDRIGMDAEKDGVMKAVYLRDVVSDYNSIDEVSGKTQRYGCSGIDGVSIGPVFGRGKDGVRKIMVAEGICGDVERTDNDNQVILQYDISVIDDFGKPLEQLHPHHSGPEACEERYFFYTGNTNWGIQNLEYDSHSGYWFVAVYPGEKTEFEHFKMFAIDGTVSAKQSELEGRGAEKGMLLTSAKIGVGQKENRIYGSHFSRGSTGIAALGDGRFYISFDGNIPEEKLFFTNVKLCRFDASFPDWFCEE